VDDLEAEHDDHDSEHRQRNDLARALDVEPAAVTVASVPACARLRCPRDRARPLVEPGTRRGVTIRRG